MTVSTVPARVTDEVFRLYVKYQVGGVWARCTMHIVCGVKCLAGVVYL